MADSNTEWASSGDGDEFITRRMLDGTATTEMYTIIVDGGETFGPFAARSSANPNFQALEFAGQQIRYSPPAATSVRSKSASSPRPDSPSLTTTTNRRAAMAEQPGNIKVAAWLAGPIGRWGRIIIGAGLVITGVLTGGVAGIIVALVGLVPVGLGMSNRCLISRVIGAPWRGEEALDIVNS